MYITLDSVQVYKTQYFMRASNKMKKGMKIEHLTNFHIHIVLHVAFFFFFLAFDFCLVYNTVSHKLNMLGVYVS